jgi:hypothetical protein
MCGEPTSSHAQLGIQTSACPRSSATGKKFAVRGVSVDRLEGGKIKENTDYYNMVELLPQIGVMPAP